MNHNCNIDPPFFYKDNNMSWNYANNPDQIIALILCIIISVSPIIAIYMYLSKKYIPSKNILVIYAILIFVLFIIIYNNQLTILYIPSSFISFFTRTPEILDKQMLFPNYIYFENETNFKNIKNEVLDVLRKTNNGNKIALTRDREGGFTEYIGSDVKIDQTGIERGWRVLNIKLGSNYSPDAVYFPTLVQLLETMPEIKACAVSILEPGVHIPVHVGYYKGVMRFMLPIVVPKNKEGVYLCVNTHKYHWTEGESVLWDDTFPHSVYNTTEEIRVVLYMDVARPYTGIFNLINNTIIDTIAGSDVIQKELKKTEIQKKITHTS